MSTGQSNFLSRENQVKAFKQEEDDRAEQIQKLIDLKLKIALDMPIDSEPLGEEQISVAHARIFDKKQKSDFFGV